MIGSNWCSLLFLLFMRGHVRECEIVSLGVQGAFQLRVTLGRLAPWRLFEAPRIVYGDDMFASMGM